jgi:spermidine synthase
LYSTTTTGFYGMLINLVLIFSYQVFYGYLINRMGLLIAIFMAGTAAGSLLVTKKLKNNNYDLKMFLRLDLWIATFSLLSAFILKHWNSKSDYGFPAFLAMFFISGAFLGFEFPLANKIIFEQNQSIGATSGILYFADLLGGWFAGILGGIIFLPILGLFNTCILIVLLKVSSSIVLIYALRFKQEKPLLGH